MATKFWKTVVATELYSILINGKIILPKRTFSVLLIENNCRFVHVCTNEHVCTKVNDTYRTVGVFILVQYFTINV